MAFSPVERVKSQLKSIRSSYLIEDPEQIIPDGMLTKFQFLGNVPIGHPLRYQVDHAFFPLCKQVRSSQGD
jgi:hypothetical protein